MRAGKANHSPTSPSAFPTLFLPLLPSSLTSLPSPDGHSCFRHGSRSLSRSFHGLGRRPSAHWEGTSTALILLCCSGKGSKAPRDMAGNWDQHCDCKSQHWVAWVLLLPEVPQGHSTLTVSSCPCSPAAWQRAGTGTDSFCQARAVSLPWSLCSMTR